MNFVGEVVSVQSIGAVNRGCYVELCCLTGVFVSVMKVPVGHRYSRWGAVYCIALRLSFFVILTALVIIRLLPSVIV